MNKRFITLATLIFASGVLLVACGSQSKQESNTSTTSSQSTPPFKVALITDASGIHDNSFNQTAWQGLKAWGQSHQLNEKTDYTYFQTNHQATPAANIQSATQSNYSLIFCLGSSMTSATEEAAVQKPNTHYVLIDGKSAQKDSNLVSVSFADEQVAYLAGIGAANASRTGKVGFIGGIKTDAITAYESGYIKGAKAANPNIQVNVQYADSFSDVAKGKALAHAMCLSGDDVIYQVAGSTGTGVFTEVKAQNAHRNEEDKIWVIGVDQDQKYLGNFTSKDNKNSNFVLLSTLKNVGSVIQTISNQTLNNKFPAGKNLDYNLKNNGIGIAYDNANDNVVSAVEQAKGAILSGKIIISDK